MNAVAQGVHLGQRDELARVAEVVGVDALAERRAGKRLGGDELDLPLAGDLVLHERERDPAEVAAAAVARDHDVGHETEVFENGPRLQADHRLVHEHVVEHRSQRVLHRAAGGRRHLHRLADGDAQGPGRLRLSSSIFFPIWVSLVGLACTFAP